MHWNIGEFKESSDHYEQALYLAKKLNQKNFQEKCRNALEIHRLYKEGKKFPFNFPFHTLNNIVLSPHRGYSPFNDLLRWNEVLENINCMAQGREDFINVVSLEEEY